MTTNNAINANSSTPLPLVNGGTAGSLTASNGGIVFSGASAMAILSGTATANQVLLSGASTAPIWSTTTYPATNAANTLLYASSANTMAALATANNSVLTTNSSGVPQLKAAGLQVSASCGNFSTTSTSLVNVTNLTVTITTLGRPVRIWLQDDGTANSSYFAVSGVNNSMTIALFRGVTQLTSTLAIVSTANLLSAPLSSFSYIETPAAGTYTYKIQASGTAGATTYFQFGVLCAMEM
jgi:hypothetical protein